jgi:hypothetical protein
VILVQVESVEDISMHITNLFLIFFSFPLNDENLLTKWMEAVKVESVTKWSRLCSIHFAEESFYKVGLYTYLHVATTSSLK